MPAPTTVDEFLDLISKSGVAETARVKAYVQKLADSGTPIRKIDALGEAMVRDGLLTFFQAEQLMQGKWKRFFIGKYKVLERIGTGGMGQVFLCEHKLMKRRVALKVLPAAKAQDPASLERFYREARAVAALDHPNIVRAYDIDQDENIHFLVMEFVDGPNLQDLVKKIGPLDPVRACHYMYGAAVGMQHAHEMGLVHRDIKPGNILIDRSGVVKVLDMGLARFFNDEEDLLTKKYDENVLGTADYLAPEQAVDSHTVDIRADIYSLGGTFYYLMTGSSPFPDGTIAQKLLWHQTRDPRPVRSLRPEIPLQVAHVIETMLRKKPEQRYQTPAEVMMALAPFVQQPIAPPPEEELPSLSAAASGQQLVAMRNSTSAVKSSVMGALPGFPGAAKSSGYGFATPPKSSNPFGFGNAAVMTGPGNEGWAKLTSDTQPKGMADTTRNPSPKMVPLLGETKTKSRRWIGILFLGLLLAGGAVGAMTYFNKKSILGKENTKLKFFVTKKSDLSESDRTFATLRSALTAATPGTTIVILDERIEEPAIPTIVGKGREGLTDCSIEPGPQLKQVTWAITPTTSGNSPSSALEFQNVQGLKISGLAIECRTMTEFGVSVLGLCPGFTLDHVTISNPNTAGVRLNNAGGESAKPILFDHVRVTATADKSIVAGLLLTAQPTMPNKFIRFSNGRLDGPGNDAIRIAGPITDVEFNGNRIANWSNGITFSSGMPNDAVCKIAVNSNTFFQLNDAAFRCDSSMPAGVKGDVSIKQNLFLKVKELAKGSSGSIVGLSSVDNARDDVSQEGKGMPLNSLVVKGSVPIDPANDATFLRYERGSPFAEIGPRKVPAGTPVE